MGNKLISRNPSKNYEILGEVEETTKEEILQKIKRAKEAQKTWANLELSKRIEILGEIYNEFEEKAEEISKIISLEMGKPIVQAENEVKSTDRKSVV